MDSAKKAFDVELLVYQNGELLNISQYKTTFKKNKKTGEGFFKIKLKKGVADKKAVKALKKNKFTFTIADNSIQEV